MSSNDSTINARKYDGSIHRSWKAKLIEQTENRLVFVGEFDRDVIHPDLGIIKKRTISYEYYWLDRWYNIFKFHEPNGEFRNYYCNINMPPVYKNKTLDYIDLDLDILVWEDSSFEVLDMAEFEQNVKKYLYPDHVVEKARETLEKLIDRIKSNDFDLR